MNTDPGFKKEMLLKSKKTRRNHSEKEKDLVLSHEDAEAASPEYESVCGEEDPGAALETLVTKKEDKQ
jgi:hypothetical protein